MSYPVIGMVLFEMIQLVHSLCFSIINQFIYLCGNTPLKCAGMLWETFNMMVNLNIQPANDAMLILLRLDLNASLYYIAQD